jgi:hypothetical protein
MCSLQLAGGLSQFLKNLLLHHHGAIDCSDSVTSRKTQQFRSYFVLELPLACAEQASTQPYSGTLRWFVNRGQSLFCQQWHVITQLRNSDAVLFCSVAASSYFPANGAHDTSGASDTSTSGMTVRLFRSREERNCVSVCLKPGKCFNPPQHSGTLHTWPLCGTSVLLLATGKTNSSIWCSGWSSVLTNSFLMWRGDWITNCWSDERPVVLYGCETWSLTLR